MTETSLNPTLAAVPPSATIGLMDRAREMKRAGVDVISLAGGEPDVPPCDAVRDVAVERIRSGELSYGPVAGLAPLREAIAARLGRDHGRPYEARQVVVGNGAKQLIFEAIFAASRPGDEVIIPAPYWVSYPAIAVLSGAKAMIVPCSSASGYKLTAEGLEAAITPASRWLILNSPNNPTGAVYTEEELAALAAVIARHPRLLVLSDDIYEDILYDGVRHCSIVAAAPEIADRVVTCSGFSKGDAMTGFRVGYAAGPQWLMSAVVNLQSHFTSGGCVVGQAAAVAAFDEGEAFRQSRQEVYARRRQRALVLLAEAPSLKMSPPDGAFYCWINLERLIGTVSPAGRPIASDQDFAEALLVEGGLAAVPGSAFGAPGHLRLSFATADAVLEEGMKRLTSFANRCRHPATAALA